MTDISNAAPVSYSDIDRLRKAGVIGARAYVPALRSIRDEEYWSIWARRALLALGLGQLLAGVIFFFAYNWEALPDFAKYGVIEAGIIAAASLAFLCRDGGLLRKSFLIVASVLVGVLLAVVGQIYQTGADVYELFLAWSVLILPWVAGSRSAPLWFIWFVVVELAASLFAEQVLVTLDILTYGQTSAIVGLLACLALGAREIAVAAGCEWLAARWTRFLPLGVALVTMFGPAAGAVVDYYESSRDGVTVAAFLALLGGAYYVYRRILPDYAVLVAAIAFANLIFILLGVRVIDETIEFDFFDAGSFFAASGFLLLWAGFGTGAAAVLMRRLRASISEAH